MLPAMEFGGQCVQCGYDLTGLTDDRPCPECGLLIGLSRLPAEELKHARPVWLARLSVGSLLVALGLFLLVTPGVTLLVLSLFLPSERATTAAVSASLLPSAVLVFVGVWWLTASSGRAGERPRWLLRILAGWVFVLAALPVVLYWLAMNVLSGPNAVAWTLSGLVALTAPLALLGFRHLAHLARRAPAPLLAADTPVMGVLVAGVFLLPLAGTVLVIFAEAGGVLIPLLAIVYALTAWLWSMYLLVRASLAFNLPRRQARALWAEAAAQGSPLPQV